jgi:UPF0271 protein
MVLDTSAFVGGFDPFTIGEEQYTTPKVETEIRDSMSALRFSTALESGKLKIVMPSPEFLKKVKTSATTVGDAFYLSETDMEILALALELKAAGNNPKIVTDDYSIQNVATQMGVEFVSLVTFGIRRLLKWVRYCPACHRKYQANSKLTSCIVCGTELKRKPLRTENKVKRTT